MKLTKYGHACLILDNNQSKLVIDPGCFTKLPADLKNISCIIVTEEHVDHFDPENLQRIIKQSPMVKIYTTKAVCDALAESGMNTIQVEGEKSVNTAGYSLNLYETAHAPTYKTSPCRSLSLKVDDYLYYPSDSYHRIREPVEVLALPTSGPWLKLEDAIEFANCIKSKKILVTHNALYSDEGNSVANHFISLNISDDAREYIFLKPGESF